MGKIVRNNTLIYKIKVYRVISDTFEEVQFKTVLVRIFKNLETSTK